MSGYRRNGKNTLAYLGVQPTTPPQMLVLKRKPTQNDVIGYTLGTLWTYITPSTPKQAIVYVLVDMQQNVATWKPLTSSGNADFGAINIQTFTTEGAGTYTPTTGMMYCIVEAVGGGGAGGTADAFSASSGGGGGGYCKSFFSADQIGSSQSIVVGTGGVAINQLPNSEGVAGTASTFGSFFSAGGGKGGNDPLNNGYGGAGGVATGADVNIAGGVGGAYFDVYDDTSGNNILRRGGIGGNSILGFGGQPVTNGSLYGSGGSGINAEALAGAGKDGADGIIIVTEFLS